MYTVKPLMISRTLVGNKIVDHSDVVGADNYIFIIDLNLASMDWTETTARWDEKYFSYDVLYIRRLTVHIHVWHMILL